MRLISLNAKRIAKLDLVTAFLRRYQAGTDVICFQETGDNAKQYAETLPNHQGFFASSEMGGFPRDNAIFVKNMSVTEHRDAGRGLIVVTSDVPCAILNFHGMWFEGEKVDHPETLEQSSWLCGILKRISIPVILAGDFNLFPDTESIAILERTGVRNLITEYRIPSTRPRDWPYPKAFSDYVFVSPGIRVTSFTALPDEVSDHLPLALEFDIVKEP